MNFKTKIIIIIAILLTLIVSSVAVLKLNNRVNVTLTCIDKEIGCIYTEQTDPPTVYEFKHDNIMQCSLETFYKVNEEDEEDHKVDYHILRLYVSSLPNFIEIEHPDPDYLVSVCSNIMTQQPFVLKSKNKIRTEEKTNK